MHIMRALIGIHRLKVLSVAHDMIFRHDPVAAVHVARSPRDIERLAAIVALYQRNHLGRAAPILKHATGTQCGL